MSFTRADRTTAENWVWDVNTLDWVQMTQPGGGSGGDASAANQVIGNASLASIDGKITAVNTGAVTFASPQHIIADASAAVIGHVVVDSAPTTAITNVSLDGTTLTTLDTDIKSNITLHAGTNLVGKVGIDQTTDGTTNKVFVGNTHAVTVSSGTITATGPLTDTQLRATAVPVSGTFFQATQPISATSLPLPTGAALDATVSTMSGKLPATVGQKAMSASLPVVVASDQSAIPVSFSAAAVTFYGRASTFRTPGRAGTAGQKILSLHNATGSSVIVSVKKVVIDLAQTVIKAVTVAPPMVRLWKVTVLPTNGTALTKNQIGGTGASSSSVTVLGDASADGTGSGTTLTATLPAGAILTQEFAARLITAAGYEVADRLEFFGDNTTITLGALQGVVLFLDYTAATQNPTTDMWIASIEWTEV